MPSATAGPRVLSPGNPHEQRRRRQFRCRESDDRTPGPADGGHPTSGQSPVRWRDDHHPPTRGSHGRHRPVRLARPRRRGDRRPISEAMSHGLWPCVPAGCWWPQFAGMAAAQNVDWSQGPRPHFLSRPAPLAHPRCGVGRQPSGWWTVTAGTFPGGRAREKSRLRPRPVGMVRRPRLASGSHRGAERSGAGQAASDLVVCAAGRPGSRPASPYAGRGATADGRVTRQGAFLADSRRRRASGTSRRDRAITVARKRASGWSPLPLTVFESSRPGDACHWSAQRTT